MRGILALIQPLNPATNTRIDVRIGLSKNARTLGADSVAWASAIARAPVISMDFLDDNYRGDVKFGAATMVVDTKRLDSWSTGFLSTLVWKGAPVTIWSGNAKTTAEMTLEFKGQVTGGVIDKRSRLLPLAMAVNRKLIDVPLLNLEYGGGGGVDGDVEVRGQLKPACFGSPVNVPIFFFDQVNNVGQIDDYGNVTAIDNLYENAAAFGTKTGNYANYAALVAASIPEGSWGTCVDEGMIRLGADPRGVITCDPVCGFGTPGAMMNRWLTNHAGVTAGNIDAASFTSLDSALATLLGHAAAVSYYTQTQVSVLDRLQAMCGSVNAVPMIMPDGKIAVSRAVSSAAAVVTINRFGGNPTVTDWRTMEIPSIHWRLKMSAAISYRVHALDEIAYNDDLVDMGNHVPGDTYREGQIVYLPSDGRRYIYINATPSTFGPPNVTYWDVYQEPIDATVLKYADGTPVETLKPAAPGADPTASNTAAAIVGQGALATKNKANWNLDLEGKPGTDLVIAPFDYANSTELDVDWNTREGAGVLTFNQSSAEVPGGKYMNAIYAGAAPVELVTNGSALANTTGWTAGGSATLSVNGGNLRVTNAGGIANGYAYQAIACTIGKTYTLAYKSINPGGGSGGAPRFQIADTAAGGATRFADAAEFSSGNTATFVATQATHYIRCISIDVGARCDFGDMSIKELKDSSIWLSYEGEPLAYDSTEVYMIEAWVRRVSGDGQVFLGLEGVAADGTTLVSTAGANDYEAAHWVGAAGALPTVGAWSVYRGFVTGKAGTGTSVQSANVDAPGAMHTNVAFIRPTIFLNAVGTGSMDLALVRLRKGDNLDRIKDGTTHGKIRGSQLTSGNHKLTVAGSGMEIGDQRNLPPVKALNLGFKFSGTVSYATTTTQCTITVSAGSFTMGSVSVSYSLAQKIISGTAGTGPFTHYLYYDDPGFAGGAKTLQSTTNPQTPFASDNRVYAGVVTFSFPSSGTGGGSGDVGGGGCILAEAWFETRDRGWIKGSDVEPGDYGRVLSEDLKSTEWAPVLGNDITIEPVVRLRGRRSGITLCCSESTPLTLEDGSIVYPRLLDGQPLPVCKEALVWDECDVEQIGWRPVAHIRMGGRVYAAGDVAGEVIFTHNLPKP